MHNRILPAILAAAAMAAATLTAAEYNVQISPANTKVEWELGGNIHSTHGTFELKKGDLWFDPESGKVRGELIVDASTGQSGNSLRDGRMKKSVLEADRFPQIVFKPDSMQGKLNLDGESTVTIHGTLTLHGTDHEMIIPAKTVIKRDLVDATLDFKIPYVEWGLKDPSTLMLRVEKTVNIKIKSEGHIGKGF